MKTLFLFLISIITFQIGMGQKNYQKGYVVTIKNDTIKGYINYQGWSNNPRKINFKNLTGDKTDYTPKEIKSFAVKGIRYIGTTVEVNISSRRTEDLSEDTRMTTRKVTTFLEVLISGDKNLYYYISNENVKNFFIGTPDHLRMLVYYKYIFPVSRVGQNYDKVRENKMYMGQLTKYLKACPSLKHRISNTKYDKRDMIHVFLQYYKCRNLNVFFQKKHEKARLNFGIIAGPSITALKFSGYPFPYLAKADFHSNINFNGGVYLNITFPMNLKRWSLQNELMYTSFMTKNQYNDTITSYYYEITNNTIGASYITLNNLVRYTYPLGKVSVYANIGLSNSFAISKTNKKIMRSSFQGNEKTKTSPAINLFKIYNLGIIGGIGAEYQKCSIEFRYEIRDEISDVIMLGSKMKKYNIFFSYRLK